MKTTTALITGTALASSFIAISHAIEVSISPAQQTVSLGTSVQAEVRVDGLGNGTALGAYDIRVAFNTTVLGFSNFQFGNQLNPPGSGITAVDAATPGVVNLSEISLLPPQVLNSTQAGSFALGTLTFNSLALGTSLLDLQLNALADAFGNPLSATVQSGTVEVAAFLGLSPSEQSVGIALVTTCQGLNAAPSAALTPNQTDLLGECNDIVAAGRAGAQAVEALTPEQVVAPSTLGVELSNTQLTNIRSRFAALRLLTTRPSLAGLALNFGNEFLANAQPADSPGQRGGGASADEAGNVGKLGVWVNGDYNFGDRDQTTNEDGFDFDNTGLTLGADYRVTEQLVLGAAVGYANTEVDFDNDGGDLERDGWAGSLYGLYYVGERFYVEGIVSYAVSDFDQQRKFSYVLPSNPPVARTATADYDGDGYALSVGAGYEEHRGPLTFGGYGRLSYSSLDIDSYQETGAQGFNLGFDSQEVESLTTTLGGRVMRAVSTQFGVLAPQGWVEWIHEFEDNDPVSGRFINAIDPAQAAFTLTPDSVDEDYFRLGVGVSAQFAQGRSAFIAYQGTLGLEHFSENAFTAGVRLEF